MTPTKTLIKASGVVAEELLKASRGSEVAVMAIVVVLPDGRSTWVDCEFTERGWRLPWADFSQRYLEPAYAQLRNDLPDGTGC